MEFLKINLVLIYIMESGKMTCLMAKENWEMRIFYSMKEKVVIMRACYLNNGSFIVENF